MKEIKFKGIIEALKKCLDTMITDNVDHIRVHECQVDEKEYMKAENRYRETELDLQQCLIRHGTDLNTNKNDPGYYLDVQKTLYKHGFQDELDYFMFQIELGRMRADIEASDPATGFLARISQYGTHWRDEFITVKNKIKVLSDADFLDIMPDLLSVFELCERKIHELDQLSNKQKENLFLQLSARRKELDIDERERKILGR